MMIATPMMAVNIMHLSNREDTLPSRYNSHSSQQIGHKTNINSPLDIHDHQQVMVERRWPMQRLHGVLDTL